MEDGLPDIILNAGYLIKDLIIPPKFGINWFCDF